MTYVVRVTENYVGVMGRHVVQGQSVAPGAPLVDIMTPEGVVETIMSEAWGIVCHVEGARIFSSANANERADDDHEDDDDDGESGSTRGSSGGVGTVFSKDALICQIMGRSDNNSIKGGRPHPSTSRSISNAKAEGRLIPTFG